MFKEVEMRFLPFDSEKQYNLYMLSIHFVNWTVIWLDKSYIFLTYRQI